MKTEISQVDSALDGVETPTTLDEGRLAEADEAGARRELPLPGGDNFQSVDEKSIQISRTSKRRGLMRRSFKSIQSRMMWNP